MNWKQIKKDCPKAYDALNKSNYAPFYDYIKKNGETEYIELWIRELYEFFDENGIYVEIQLDHTLEIKYAPFVWWDVIWDGSMPIEDLYTEEKNWWQDEFLYRTRIQAEAAAFIKSFEILENNLK